MTPLKAAITSRKLANILAETDWRMVGQDDSRQPGRCQHSAVERVYATAQDVALSATAAARPRTASAAASSTALYLLLPALLLCGSATHAAAQPRVDLLTMGQSEQVYARFGHAALRVRGDGDDLVYNFGYTDFGNERLVIDTLQGRASFWGVRLSFERTLNEYARQDRTIYWQPLRLLPHQHAALARRLRQTVRGRSSTYTYHHYYDNCSTRLRDLIDEVLGGQMRAQLAGKPYGMTFRELSRQGLADSLPLLLASDYLLGRRTDIPVDWWHAGFLPRLLREAVQRVQIDGQPLAPPAQIIYQRRQPMPRGNPRAGEWVIGAFGVALGLLACVGLLLVRRRSRSAGLPVALLSFVLGLLAIPPWVLALAVALPELSHNELILLLWPTDLLLVGLGVRLLRGRFRAGRVLRGYTHLRAFAIAVGLLGQLVGLLYQRPRVWLLFAAAPLLPLVLLVRHLSDAQTAPPPSASTGDLPAHSQAPQGDGTE